MYSFLKLNATIPSVECGLDGPRSVGKCLQNLVTRLNGEYRSRCNAMQNSKGANVRSRKKRSRTSIVCCVQRFPVRLGLSPRKAADPRSLLPRDARLLAQISSQALALETSKSSLLPMDAELSVPSTYRPAGRLQLEGDDLSHTVG
jgi:hypothetical protein